MDTSNVCPGGNGWKNGRNTTAKETRSTREIKIERKREKEREMKSGGRSAERGK
jgi:hypothetical protein